MNREFYSSLGSFRLTDQSLRSDNDLVDRLNYYYTSLILVVFAVIVSAKQYVGKPLQCWIPAEFNSQWEQYTESYCWVKSTYFVPMNESRLPEGAQARRRHEINYYQYVPFILALMALAFNAANVAWKILVTFSGVRVAALVRTASSVIQADPKDRPEAVMKLAQQLEESVCRRADDKHRKRRLEGLQRLWNCLRGRQAGGVGIGCCLTLSYLAVKIMYCLIAAAQLVIVCQMLSSSYRVFDVGVIQEIFQGKSWRRTGIFPRVTHCDFEIRRLAARHPYTVQCVLTVNLFNEKIFLFLWFWYLALCLLNLCSLLSWLASCLPCRQVDLMQDHLTSCDHHIDQRQLESFTRTHVLSDGSFLLRIIEANSGHLIATELVHQLWTNWLHRRAAADSDPRFSSSAPG